MKALCIPATLLSVIILSTNVLANDTTPCLSKKLTSALENKLDKTINQLLENNPSIPGVILYVENEKNCFKWQGAKGFIDTKSNQYLTTKNTFRIASNTKTYTAATMLRLAELGKVNIDDSIEKYLPESYRDIFRKNGVSLEKITVRNILNHTSGLPEHTRDKRYFEKLFREPQYKWKPLETVGLIFKYKMKINPPNAEFLYSDTGYILLATAIKNVTKLSLTNSFKQYLNFNNLGIENTWHETLETKPKHTAERAHQYYDEIDTYDWDPSFDLYGGGGLVSTAEDMAIFLKGLMKGKVFEDKNTLNLMKTVINISSDTNYGMGLYSLDVDGKKVWGHTGFWNTFAFYETDNDILISGSIMQKNTIKGTVFMKKVMKIVTASLQIK
jgi:D-alanyl-D-alanine carboxypeptidase